MAVVAGHSAAERRTLAAASAIRSAVPWWGGVLDGAVKRRPVW